MTEHDDRLPADLRDYYGRLAAEPGPDVTARVMRATDARTRRLRAWSVFGGGALAVGAAAAVVAIALANHASPGRGTPGGSSTPLPPTSPTSTTAPTATSTPLPSPAAPMGAPAHGFVPIDVTAVSVSEWWVLGDNGPSCSSPACTRILHTVDGGSAFTSIPVPPVAPATGTQPAARLRFADPVNGWLVDPTGAVWATHDGGGHWAEDGSAGTVTDLEASGGRVVAVTCSAASTCELEATPSGQESWSLLPQSAGHGRLGRLNVNGADVWVSVFSPAGAPGTLLASTDAGQHFSSHTVCPGLLGFADLYAVDSTVVWATCATGMEASLFRSIDGGQTFTAVQSPGIPNSATVAGVSSTTAVIGGQVLSLTNDGGSSYTTVEDNQSQWTMVGFTTARDGFALDLATTGTLSLWRTGDAGRQWHSVQFP